MAALLRSRGGPRKPPAVFSWIALHFAAALALSSCGQPAKPVTVSTVADAKTDAPAVEASTSPEALLYEQLRSGSFQLSAAASSIEEALLASKSALQKLTGDAAAREAMLGVIDFLDSAGQGVAEFADSPPDKEKIAAAFATYDERRLKAIESANDSLQDIREAIGILDDIADGGREGSGAEALAVKALAAVALDDVWGAIEALGGVPEATDEPLNP